MSKKVSLTSAQTSKRWRENNKEAYRKGYLRYYEENKQEIRKRQNAWRNKNPDYRGGNKISSANTKDSWIKYKLTSLKRSAKVRGLEFNLEASDISSLMVSECPISNVHLKYKRFTNIGKIGPNSPSVDRIDNSKGYIQGNIQIISAKINRLKGENSIRELLTMCKQLINFYGENNE